MRKTKKIIKKIILEFETTPMVSVVCKKVSISRQTLYRWLKEDPSFREQVEQAKNYGIEHMNDIAESQMIKKIQEGDSGMIKFSLRNNHPRYHTKERIKEEKKKDTFRVGEVKIVRPCANDNCKDPTKIIDVTEEDY